ncbi:DUF4097 family beta strand repeat-containing protein (plasmid) [Microtetraspora malaysiensis]|uniref:DUF4097 family beta strand repeat-containing protein n=1 Tax=Microtetraspora malaysiensis TaxID=161358 RepID=UPI003D8E225F
MKITAIAGGLLASAMLLTGCGLDAISKPKNEETSTYQVKEKVQQLHLRSGSGNVAVTESDATYVSVTERLYWSNDKPQAGHKMKGDALSVYYDCRKSWGTCGVDYKVEIPKGVQVNLDAGSGDLTLRSLTGPLDLKVGSGDIEGDGLGGKKLLAEAGSGNVTLKYAAAPDGVELSVGSGDVVLTVPDETYDVNTRTTSGNANISVKKDSSSPRKMSLTTGSGDVTVSAG